MSAAQNQHCVVDIPCLALGPMGEAVWLMSNPATVQFGSTHRIAGLTILLTSQGREEPEHRHPQAAILLLHLHVPDLLRVCALHGPASLCPA